LRSNSMLYRGSGARFARYCYGTWGQRSLWLLVPEHRKTTFRIRFGRLVFDHIPMFHENATFDPDNIGGDPVSGKPVSGKTPQ
jgi:hypothetical protein